MRQNAATSATDMFGELAAFTGGGQGDEDILFEVILRQERVARINARVDLVGHYSAPHAADPIFALATPVTIEGIVDHWQRIARVHDTQSSGLIELRMLAFAPEMARDIAGAVVDESQTLVNELNTTSRADAMRFSEQDIAAARGRLRSSREALTAFCIRSQIVDPKSDFQGRMRVLNNLQQQLAEALIGYVRWEHRQPQ